MPRKKGKKQANQPVPPTTTSVIFAKCTGCQLNKELQACTFCQYPECVACIEKHREANKLAQRKTILETRTNHLRQQTALRYEILEQSLESTTVSLDLLKSISDNFGRMLQREYDEYEQKLKQSPAINDQHINDLKRMWIEYEEKSINSVDNSTEIDHILDQIETVLTSKPVQPNAVLPSLGSLNECSSNLVVTMPVKTEEQKSNVQVFSALSSDTKTSDKMSTSDCMELNEKTMKNPSKTATASSESRCEATNTKGNKQQIVKTHDLEKCDKITTSDVAKQCTSSEHTSAVPQITDAGSEVQNISNFSENINAMTMNKCITNTIVTWLNPNIDYQSEDVKILFTHLQCAVNSINVYNDIDQCIDFLTQIKYEQVFMIISGSLSQQLIPTIEGLTQLHSIYILSDHNAKYEELGKQCKKLKGVFTQMESICHELGKSIYGSENDLIPISIVPSTSVTSFDTLDQSFMYSQLLKEIILDGQYDGNAKQELVDFCRIPYAGNGYQLRIIDEFETRYDHTSSIWWYTRECFIYMMLNKALRTQDLNVIMKMAFFIQDLHRQLEQLHSRLDRRHSLIVYRGQGMLNADFEKMTQNQGALFSFNTFLSTSTRREISFNFARRARINVDMTGILFQMKIDPRISSIPFASLDHVSHHPGENEILFSMHTVFRIGEIIQIEDRLWQIDLTLTSDTDRQLKYLTDYLRTEIGGGDGWQRMCILLFKMGEFDKAVEIYKTLIEKISNANGDESAVELATTYNNMALTYESIGQYSIALSCFEKTLEIKLKSLYPSDPSFAITYNNMGMVHNVLGAFSKALSCYEKALEIWQRSLSSDHPSLASLYNNMGAVYKSLGKYPIALSYCTKALEIWKKSLPSNHPQLATIYNNMGSMYLSNEDYSNARSSLDKALEIQRKSLPSNHPELATTYSNIGAACKYLGESSNALSYFEKALEIRQKSLSPKHPDLAETYTNIGVIHVETNNASTAIVYLKKALEIQQESLLPNHSTLAEIYSTIGMAEQSLDHSSIALSYYEKALDIWRQTLPSNHPSMVNIYNNMAITYHRLGQNREAVKYAEQAVTIAREIFGLDHSQTKFLQFFFDQLRRRL